MENVIDLKFMPLSTKKVFEVLEKSTFIGKYTLVGGTALSIQIKHRISEDLDFVFDKEKLNTNTIKRNIANLFPDYKIIKQDYDYQIDFLVNNTKLTFFSTGAVLIPFKVKDYSFKYGKINIATKNIIASLKFATIAQRNTIRDYYDLYFLSKHIVKLDEIIRETKVLFPNLSPITYTETIIYTDDIPENDLSNHLEPKENVTKKEMEVFFVNELKNIFR